MTCPRCQGLLVYGWMDTEHSEGAILPAHHCVLCGFWEDMVMRQARLARERDKEPVKA